jgi:hypothetical protein
MLSSLIDNTIDMVRINGISEEDMVHMRYEIMKQAAEVGREDAVLFMKKQYKIWVVLAGCVKLRRKSYSYGGTPPFYGHS